MKIVIKVTLGNADTDNMDSVNVLVPKGRNQIRLAIEKAEKRHRGLWAVSAEPVADVDAQ